MIDIENSKDVSEMLAIIKESVDYEIYDDLIKYIDSLKESATISADNDEIAEQAGDRIEAMREAFDY